MIDRFSLVLCFFILYRRRSLKTNPNPPEEKSDCKQSLVLPRLESLTSIRGGLFLMETSGRARLTGRQACAVESAASRSGLQVVLILLSGHLDLRDNTTCSLTRSRPEIKFYTVDLETIGRDTPLGNHHSYHSNTAAMDKVFHKTRTPGPFNHELDK